MNALNLSPFLPRTHIKKNLKGKFKIKFKKSQQQQQQQQKFTLEEVMEAQSGSRSITLLLL
jgi:hypothetical protein